MSPGLMANSDISVDVVSWHLHVYVYFMYLPKSAGDAIDSRSETAYVDSDTGSECCAESRD